MLCLSLFPYLVSIGALEGLKVEVSFKGWGNTRGLTQKDKTQDKIGISSKPTWLA
jgi:hypothetical protein